MTVSVKITDDDGKTLRLEEEHALRVDDVYLPGHAQPSILLAIASFQKRRFEKGAAALDI